MPKTKFTAVGAHEGQTITLGRFDFVEGVYTFEGSDQDTDVITRVMRDQYQAYPPDTLEAGRKAYEDAVAEFALGGSGDTPAISEMNVKQRIVARRFIDEGLNPDEVYGPGEAADMVKANIDALRTEDADGTDVVVTAEQIAAQRAKSAADKAEQERLEKEAADKAEAERLEKEAADKAAADDAEKARIAKEEADKAAADAGQSQDNGGGEQKPEDAKIETVADALQALDPSKDDHWTSRGVPSIEAMVKLLGRAVTRAKIEEVAPDYTRSVAKAAKAAANT